MHATGPSTHEAQLRAICERLAEAYRGILSPQTVERLVRETYRELRLSARIDIYLPLLTERFARDRLRALGQAEGLIAKTQPEVLFVCVHNAGRSQMAAALLRHLSDERIEARSAGSHPSAEVDPVVAEAMREIGLDLDVAFPKPLTDEVARAADVIITMGCGDSCPVYPGKRYQDWDLPDPAGQSLEVVRTIRGAIEHRVRALLRDLDDARL